jgi:fumarate reductase iron-sulfur subunit
MRISIKRGKEFEEFKLPFKSTTLLKALYHIKSYQDQTLTFDANCRSGVCGACAVRVNEMEVLACSYKIQDGDRVEPLRYHIVQRDLRVDKNQISPNLKRAKSWISSFKDENITDEDIIKIEKQTDCILCSSCYSACPIFEVNPNFLAPFAFTRNYRYLLDKREDNKKEKIDSIQQNGVWDCTLCGACSEACPQNIDIKRDILMLRGESSRFGYFDPNFSTMSFGSF